MTEQTLEDPGPPLVLTMKTTSKWETNINYTVAPEVAVAILREIADAIEAGTLK